MTKVLKLFRDGIPLFETLREKKRQQILNDLILKGPMMVNEITELSSLSRPAVSHHLKLLKQVNLVKVEENGTKRIYSANISLIIPYLRDLLAELESKVEEDGNGKNI